MSMLSILIMMVTHIVNLGRLIKKREVLQMKKVLNIMIPYGIQDFKFLNYEIREAKEVISYGRLYLDGTAYISRWGEKSYDVDDADSSIKQMLVIFGFQV